MTDHLALQEEKGILSQTGIFAFSSTRRRDHPQPLEHKALPGARQNGVEVPEEQKEEQECKSLDTEKNLSSSKLLNNAPKKEQTAQGDDRAERKRDFQKVSMNQFHQTSKFLFKTQEMFLEINCTTCC